jgi:hypothetical protein
MNQLKGRDGQIRLKVKQNKTKLSNICYLQETHFKYKDKVSKPKG